MLSNITNLAKRLSTRKTNIECNENGPKSPSANGAYRGTVGHAGPQAEGMHSATSALRHRRRHTAYPMLHNKDLKHMLGDDAPVRRLAAIEGAIEDIDIALRGYRIQSRHATDGQKCSQSRESFRRRSSGTEYSDISPGSVSPPVFTADITKETPLFHPRPRVSLAPFIRESESALREWDEDVAERELIGSYAGDDFEPCSPNGFDIDESHQDGNAVALSPARKSSDVLPLPSPTTCEDLTKKEHDDRLREENDWIRAMHEELDGILERSTGRNNRKSKTEKEYENMLREEADTIQEIDEELDRMLERSSKLLDEGKQGLSEVSSEGTSSNHMQLEEEMGRIDGYTVEFFNGNDPFCTPAHTSDAKGKHLASEDETTTSLGNSHPGSPLLIVPPPSPSTPDETVLHARNEQLSGKPSLRHTGRLSLLPDQRFEVTHNGMSNYSVLAPSLPLVAPLSPLSISFPQANPLIKTNHRSGVSTGRSDIEVHPAAELDVSAAQIQAVLSSQFDIQAPVEAVRYAMSVHKKQVFDTAFSTDEERLFAAAHAMLLIRSSLREWHRMQEPEAVCDEGTTVEIQTLMHEVSELLEDVC